MEYRIAPFIIFSLGILLLIFTRPENMDVVAFQTNGLKLIIGEGIMLILGISAFFRHDFYTLKSKILFYTLLFVFSLLWINFIYHYFS